MKLITKELLRRIPPLYSQENESEPLAVCKFFMPDGAFTWYVIEGSTREKSGCGFGVNCNHKPLAEYDSERDDILFFGYVVGIEPEYGYFSLSELESIRGSFGFPVERDLYFDPCRVSSLRAKE
jgi:hypothetical protein